MLRRWRRRIVGLKQSAGVVRVFAGTARSGLVVVGGLGGSRFEGMGGGCRFRRGVGGSIVVGVVGSIVGVGGGGGGVAVGGDVGCSRLFGGCGVSGRRGRIVVVGAVGIAVVLVGGTAEGRELGRVVAGLRLDMAREVRLKLCLRGCSIRSQPSCWMTSLCDQWI